MKEALYVNVDFRINPKQSDADAFQAIKDWLKAQPLPPGVKIERVEVSRWQVPDDTEE